jgi:hypothetical protein
MLAAIAMGVVASVSRAPMAAAVRLPAAQARVCFDQLNQLIAGRNLHTVTQRRVRMITPATVQVMSAARSALLNSCACLLGHQNTSMASNTR